MFLIDLQAVDDLFEFNVGVEDLGFLDPDFLLCPVNIELVALDKGAEFLGSLGVETDAALGSLNLVFEILDVVAGAGDGLLELLEGVALCGRSALLFGYLQVKAFLGLSEALDFLVDMVDLAIKLVELPAAEVGIENAQVGNEGLITPSLCCLALKGADLAFHLFDDIGHAQEVGLGSFELTQGLFLLELEFGDPCGFLKNGPAILRA